MPPFLPQISQLGGQHAGVSIYLPVSTQFLPVSRLGHRATGALGRTLWPVVPDHIPPTPSNLPFMNNLSNDVFPYL